MPDLTWTDVADRLAAAQCYWVHTTGAAGAPHASPVWGAVVDGVLYHYTTSTTQRARDLERDPRAVVHLESAANVLIVHGRLRHAGRPSDHPDVLTAFDQKYTGPEEVAFLPSNEPAFDVLYALEPLRALSWSLPDTEASTQRWMRDAGEVASG